MWWAAFHPPLPASLWLGAAAPAALPAASALPLGALSASALSYIPSAVLSRVRSTLEIALLKRNSGSPVIVLSAQLLRATSS